MKLSDTANDVDCSHYDMVEIALKEKAISLSVTHTKVSTSETDGEVVDSQAGPSLTLVLARYITDLGVDQGINLLTEVRRFERGLIERALDLTNGNQKRAAKLLGLQSSTLYTKIQKYGLKANRRKTARR